MLKFFIALLSLTLTLRAQADDLPAIIDPLVEPVLKDKKNIGLVVAVWQDGKSQVFGYGKVFTPVGEQVPDGRTLFEIGSITKSFTGVLLAEAVQRGEVTLDDPINKHLPPDLQLKSHPDGPATLLHFATHRSGWPVQPPLIGLIAKDSKNPYASYDRKKLVGLLATLTPKKPPGDEYEYSNLGAGLVGHALAHVAKADGYNALLQDRIAKPLGLKDTTEAPNGEQRARMARGYDKVGEPVSGWDFATLEGCGAIRSTANDMIRYAAANLGEIKTPLQPALSLSHKRQRADGRMQTGLFWVLMTLPDSEIQTIWHNGGTSGYRSMLMMVPKTKAAVVVLCSASQDKVIDKLAIDIVKALHPEVKP